MFYISSRGSSANQWLTKILSKHPKIVCLRSSRSFPPVGLGVKKLANRYKIEEISPDFFINSLIECESATLNEKIFGSTHGYHGTIAKKACEDNNGYFAYITRHPLDRIHSALIHYLDLHYYNKDKKLIDNNAIDKRLVDIFSSSNVKKDIEILKEINASSKTKNQSRTKIFLKKIMPKNILDHYKNLNKRFFSKPQTINFDDSNKFNFESKEVFYIYNLMSSLLDSFFFFERDLIKNCSPVKGIKMEEMVSSQDYFEQKIFKRLTPSIEIDKNFIIEIFKEKRYNSHRDNPLSSKEIWDTWPEVLRSLFLKKFYEYEINTSMTTWDYDVSFF